MRPLSIFRRDQTEQQVQDFLMAHTDALIAGTLDLEQLALQYDMVDPEQIEALLALAEQVSATLPAIAPSDQFVARLRHELSQADLSPGQSWWNRLRQLPPRTQLAAAGLGGATLTAGVVLLARGPLQDMLEAWRERRSAA